MSASQGLGAAATWMSEPRPELTLLARLGESAPEKLQMLVGPRQVGKTTLLLELAERWGERAVYASADAPEAELPGWADAVWRRGLERAASGPAVLLLDEVHFFPRLEPVAEGEA